VTSPTQRQAMQAYRRRLTHRGFARFEVQALETDRDLIRALARRLSDKSPEAEKARAAVRELIVDAPKSSLLQALRRSPLHDADLDLTRRREEGREVDL
jgi:hypothetical protein